MLKILCPLDFSNVSITACRYAADFLTASNGGTLELLHCIDVSGGATSFRKMNDIYEEIAQRELHELYNSIKKEYPDLDITSKIVTAQPGSFVPKYAHNSNIDLIILGSKKITILKDMTIGSVADKIMQNSKVALIIVPENIKFKSIKTVVVAIDQQLDNVEKIVRPVIHLISRFRVKLYMIHVSENAEEYLGPDMGLELNLKGLDYEFKSIPMVGNVAATLSQFSSAHAADLLCMLHRRRSWIGKIFHHSYTKTEMFKMNTPLMVLEA